MNAEGTDESAELVADVPAEVELSAEELAAADATRVLRSAIQAASIASSAAAPTDVAALMTLGLQVEGPVVGEEGEDVDPVGELGAELDLALDGLPLGFERGGARGTERVVPVEPGRPIADQVADAVRKLASDAAGDGVIRFRGGDAGDFVAHVRHDGLQLSLRLVAEGAARGVLDHRLPEVRDALLRAGFQLERLDVATSERHAPRRDPSGRHDRPDADADLDFEMFL